MAFGPWGGAAIGAAGDLIGGLVGAFKKNPYATNIRPEYAGMFSSLPEGLKGFHTPDQQRLMQNLTKLYSQRVAAQTERPIDMPVTLPKYRGDLLNRAVALRNQIG